MKLKFWRVKMNEKQEVLLELYRHKQKECIIKDGQIDIKQQNDEIKNICQILFDLKKLGYVKGLSRKFLAKNIYIFKGFDLTEKGLKHIDEIAKQNNLIFESSFWMTKKDKAYSIHLFIFDDINEKLDKSVKPNIIKRTICILWEPISDFLAKLIAEIAVRHK